MVTYKLKKLLESVGIQVFLTRTDENALCADDVYTKKLDMQLRGELIAGVKPDIIVSIHMNSYPDPSAVSYTHLDVYKRQVLHRYGVKEYETDCKVHKAPAG